MIEVVAIAILVCATVVASLAMVLRHLAAMRATAGELSLLRAEVMASVNGVSERINREIERGDEHSTKLINLINRTTR